MINKPIPMIFLYLLTLTCQSYCEDNQSTLSFSLNIPGPFISTHIYDNTLFLNKEIEHIGSTYAGISLEYSNMNFSFAASAYYYFQILLDDTNKTDYFGYNLLFQPCIRITNNNPCILLGAGYTNHYHDYYYSNFIYKDRLHQFWLTPVLQWNLKDIPSLSYLNFAIGPTYTEEELGLIASISYGPAIIAKYSDSFFGSAKTSVTITDNIIDFSLSLSIGYILDYNSLF